jgi:hypothetical protein
MPKPAPTHGPRKAFLRRNFRTTSTKHLSSDANGTLDQFVVVLLPRGLRAGIQSGSSEMTVETILATKGADVTTIEPTATLEYGIGILAARGIGALVVLGADHRVIGLLSERDSVRALANRGASVLTEPLARVMTRTKSTCTNRGVRPGTPPCYWRYRIEIGLPTPDACGCGRQDIAGQVSPILYDGRSSCHR